MVSPPYASSNYPSFVYSLSALSLFLTQISLFFVQNDQGRVSGLLVGSTEPISSR
jgi:hypothetical protein